MRRYEADHCSLTMSTTPPLMADTCYTRQAPYNAQLCQQSPDALNINFMLIARSEWAHRSTVLLHHLHKSVHSDRKVLLLLPYETTSLWHDVADSCNNAGRNSAYYNSKTCRPNLRAYGALTVIIFYTSGTTHFSQAY